MKVYIIWGTVFFVFFIIYPVHANNICYRAKICVHDGKEKCGRDGDGNLRRFLDACDIREYNCLRETEYKKVDNKECRDLPSIDEQVSKETSKKVKGDEKQNFTGEDNENQDNSGNVNDQDVETPHNSDEKKEDEDSPSNKEKRRNKAL